MFIQLRNPINLHYYLFYYFLENKINFIVLKRENASKMDSFVKYGYRYGYPDRILFLLSIKNHSSTDCHVCGHGTDFGNKNLSGQL